MVIMKKSDLISGKHVVELENGDKYLYLDGYFVNGRFWYDKDVKICKIFEIQKPYSLTDMLIFDKGLNLIWESKELSDVEKVILENLDKEYKYIVRDESGKLYLYSREPHKFCKMWISSFPESCGFYIFDNLFQMVKWEDKEPTLIADLLEGNE